MNAEHSNICFEAPDQRTRWRKLVDWLFPQRHCFSPQDDGTFRDGIRGEAIAKLSWADRFRVLATGVVVCRWYILTANRIGRMETNATCHIGTSADLKDLA